MRKMKDSGIDWIGEIPVDWDLIKCRRIFSFIKRIVGENADNYERLALTLNGVIKRDKWDNEGLQPEKFEGYQILKTNELVFKLIDLENVKTSRVGLSNFTGLVSPAYIVLTNNLEDNRFYYYWFISMYYNEVFNHLGGDGVRSSLNAKDVLKLPVPNIDVESQNNISEYLDIKCSKIDEYIAKQQQLIEKLKEYKSSIINEIIVNVEGKSCHLGYISNLKNGLNFNNTSEGHALKFLGVGNFKDFFVLDKKEMFSEIIISDDIAEDYMLHDGDIVFVRSNGSKELVGRSVMVQNIDFPLTYSGFCIRLRNTRPDLINSEFLLYFFRSTYFRKQLEKYSIGSNISNINQDLLSRIILKIPPLSKQEKAVQELKSKLFFIDECIDKKQVLINKLTEYKKSLIYEVVTGKKEV